jgi:hypothetical protein
MNKLITALIATSGLALGCGASQPPPTQQLADVQSATRAAEELGATREPQAQLHLKLAEEQMAKAKLAMDKEDNPRAESILARAKADAELAVALMHLENAKQTSAKADDQANSQTSLNAMQEQGATP